MTDKQTEKLREMCAAHIAYISQLTAEQRQEAFNYVVFLLEYTLARIEKKNPVQS